MKNLTKRELEILELLIEGRSNREIAETLFISAHTVKSNLEAIYQKFGIHNRVLLALSYAKMKNIIVATVQQFSTAIQMKLSC